jgi:hypothetical protein
VVEWIAGKVAQELAVLAAAAAASAGLSQVLDVLRRIYKAIQSAVRYMARMLEMLNKVLDTVMDIVSGAIEKAGERLEAAMHTGMPVVIGFLANQVGLGGIGQALRDIVDALRKKVDEALLWLIDKIKDGLDALIAGIRTAAKAVLDWWNQRIGFKAADGEQHHIALEGQPPNTEVYVESDRTRLSTLVAEITDNAERGRAEKKRDELAESLKTLTSLDAELLAREGAGQNVKAVVAKINARKKVAYRQLDQMAKILVDSGVLEDGNAKGEPSEAPKPAGRRVSQLIPGAEIGGETMTATRLTPKHPKGTHTSSWPNEFWRALQASDRNYVQGHMLNRELGGSGTELSNLTPLTSSGNGLHKTRAENDVKRLVNTQKKAVHYKVRVNYPSKPLPSLATVQALRLSRKAADRK